MEKGEPANLPRQVGLTASIADVGVHQQGKIDIQGVAPMDDDGFIGAAMWLVKIYDRSASFSGLLVSRLVCPVKGILQHIMRDRNSERRSHFGGCSEMDAREDARILHIFERRGETAEGARHSRHSVGIHLEVRILSELMGKNDGCGAADT